tara:strand:+ start:527 stop:1360 length:834 start_codon:yes stop_codon:yes gene_type:complete
MATFEAQVHALTNIGATLSGSTTPTDSELDQFLKDGVIDVTEKCIAAMPGEIQSFQRVSSTQSSNNSFFVNGAKILSVLREANADGSSDGSTAWRPCRQVPVALESRVVDSTSLEFASKFNPVYIIGDNNAVNVYPVPDGSDDGFKVYYVNNIPVNKSGADLVHSHSDIGYFDDNKVYLVVIYAAIKCIEVKMADMHDSIPSYSSSTDSDDWKFIKTAIETEEDLELAATRAQTLSGEMQQFLAEYQWYQGRAQSLKQEYMMAFNINTPEPQTERRR